MAKAQQQEVTVLEETATPPQASPLVHVLNALVSRPDLDLDRIERMIDLQMKVEANEARKAYAAAFADMQPHLPIVGKRGKGHNDKAYGLWEDIVEEITPVTGKYGFSISFRTAPLQTAVEVTCILRHRDGHQEETSYPFPLDTTGNKNGVQAIGSTVSYGRRYTASAMLNLVTKGEDDDGLGAGGLITDEQQERLKALLAEIDGEPAKFLAVAKADSYDKIKASQFTDLEKRLLKAKEKRS